MLTFCLIMCVQAKTKQTRQNKMKNQLNKCPRCATRLKITRYECPYCGTSVTGEFSGCPFCRLSDEERLFALIFIQTEGNMKDVERVMGISYPTVKARLAKINEILGGKSSMLMGISDREATNEVGPDERAKILDRLKAGEISAKEAAGLMRGETIEHEDKDDDENKRSDEDE